jgi:hypothetical protein
MLVGSSAATPNARRLVCLLTSTTTNAFADALAERVESQANVAVGALTDIRPTNINLHPPTSTFKRAMRFPRTSLY